MDEKRKKEKSFVVKLGEAYYNQGFFNVRQSHADKIDGNQPEIKVQLGNNPKNTIQGRIDRTANLNRTPRVMMGTAYTEWVKTHFKQGDSLTVDILSPVSIRLNTK